MQVDSSVESTCTVIPQFLFNKTFFFLMEEAPAHFSLEGFLGWGRRSPVKLGGIMCVKHTGVRYQHFASEFIAGGRQRAFSALSDSMISWGLEKKNSSCGNVAPQFIRWFEELII